MFLLWKYHPFTKSGELRLVFNQPNNLVYYSFLLITNKLVGKIVVRYDGDEGGEVVDIQLLVGRICIHASVETIW